MKSWTPRAEMYDFGRPFPEEQLLALFKEIDDILPKGPLSVFEPGCGTGRILVPLANHFPAWKFHGVDLSSGSLEVCRERCRIHGLTNLEVSEQSILDGFKSMPVDLILHSSVFHVIPSWRDVLRALTEQLRSGGVFALIGDYGDLYDAALGRVTRTDVDPNLLQFWQRYLDLRKHFGAPDPETSQIGCRWDLSSSELAEELVGLGYRELRTVSTSWNESLSISKLLRIVEERCYSSMFTVDPAVYELILAQLKREFEAQELVIAISSHQAAARFFGKL